MRKSIILLFLIVFINTIVQGNEENTGKPLPEAVKIRRYLHENPELGNREKKTTEFIIKYLKECGYQVNENNETYGVKAVLKGRGKGLTVGIRADMDALPIEEKNDIPFHSKNKEIMHACGHDVNMTNLLIVAKTASKLRERINGNLVFIFQPCEEGPPTGEKGGASRMIEEGVLENPHIDAMIGQHISPDLESGTIGIREGPIMAGGDIFNIDIIGKSSHGAAPQKGIDAIYAASIAIIEFEGIISRMKNPVDPAVLTTAKIEGGERWNTLAEKVHIEGTVRTFTEETRELIKGRMKCILDGLKTSYGIDYKFDYSIKGPALNNDPGLYGKVLPALEKVLPKEKIVIIPQQIISEDFAFYSKKVPSFYFFLGVGNKVKGYTSGIHTPTLMVDEEALLYGPGLLLECAIAVMNDVNIDKTSIDNKTGKQDTKGTALTQTSCIKHIDFFGSNQISISQVNKMICNEIKELGHVNPYIDVENYNKIKDEIIKKIKKMGEFAFVDLSIISYFDKDNSKYLTIDLVDENDRKTRMSFLPEPKGSYPDPSGLLALWDEYAKKGLELLRNKQLLIENSKDKTQSQPFHQLWGFNHPDVSEYERIFNEKVPENRDELVRILKNDGNSKRRGDAAYLLAHLKDGQDLIRILMPSIKDSSSYVRNNVMRVLAYISMFHKELAIPLEPVLTVLNFPSTTDRNKASAIIDGLACKPENREIIMKHSGRILLRMLRLYQPNNHDFAYSILKKISGKGYGDRDYASWEKWYSVYKSK